MRSLCRIFSLGLICSLLISSSDAASTVRLSGRFGAFFRASMGNRQAPGGGETLRQHLPTASVTEALNASKMSRGTLTYPHNETYASAASGGPRIEYVRSGRSPLAAQSPSIVPVSPGAYQTPDPGQGGVAVSSPMNNGHGTTTSFAGVRGSVKKNCRWSGFQTVSGLILSITLKVDWNENGAPNDGTNSFRLEYSLDNGSSWNILFSHFDINAQSSGTAQVSLPSGQDISRVQVRDVLTAFATATSSSSVTASVSLIRLEVEAVNCIVSVPANQWKGEYFNNQTLSGSPTMVRDDSTPGSEFLSRDFVGGSPNSFCAPAVDNFSARWTRTVYFAQGIHRFTASVDNGVRLYVDGYLRIDQWENSPLNTYTADVFLDAGNHEIKLEFIEYTGGASVSLSWAAVSGVNCYASVPADRWKGEYYSNTNLSGSPAMVRNDGGGSLNFNFGGGGPGSGCGLGEDYFSARWTRTVNLGAGVYRFSVTGDDGVRLYVDGQLVIDKWFTQAATTYTSDLTFSSAGPRQIKLEYFESSGPAAALLSWTDLTGVNCLPNLPLPLISSVPQTGGRDNIASIAPSQAPKRCGQKNSD
jgi:hypothetical protein